MVINKNTWDPEEAGVQLRGALTGPAQVTAYSLPDYDFPALEEELLERYGTSPRDARLQLSRLQRDKAAPIEKLADDIHRLVHLSEGHAMTEKGLVDREIETLLDTIDNPLLSSVISSQHPKSLREAMKVAKQHDSFVKYRRSKVSSTPDLRQLQDESDEEPSSPNAVVAMNQLTAQIQQLTDNVRCFICEGNHFAKGCPNKRKRSQDKNPRKPKVPQSSGNE
jgi:hypothetical protein